MILAKRCQIGEHHLPYWGGKVHLLADRYKPDSSFGQFIQGFKGDLGIPRKPVQLVNHENVVTVSKCLVDCLSEERPGSDVISVRGDTFLNPFFIDGSSTGLD